MTDFSFRLDSQGERVYYDQNVQKAYINLKRISNFVSTCQIKTELEYTNICQNVQADGDTNTTTDFLFNLLVGGFEFMGDIEFPWVGKTGGKIAGWILSALVDTWRSEPPHSLQNNFNNVWNGIKQTYDEVKINVDTWIDQLGPDIWTRQFKCPKTGEIVYISQLGDIDYLPDNTSTEFDNGAIAVANQSKYLVNKILVPTRWKFNFEEQDTWWDCYYTRWNDSYPYDGPFYDGLSEQSLFGVYTSFPDIDVVQAQTNENHCLYFSTEDTEQYNHNWFTNDKLYKGTLYKKWELININNSGTAPDFFISYLFNDGAGGDQTNGISSHDDVFNNWSMK
jgi:hypothetical protein